MCAEPGKLEIGYYQPIYRTLEELVAPVADSTSPLSSIYRFERAQTYETRTPFIEGLSSYGCRGDVRTSLHKFLPRLHGAGTSNSIFVLRRHRCPRV